MVPYTRACGRRVWVRAHWGRVKIRVPCRGSGKASGGDGHGFFLLPEGFPVIGDGAA